MLELIPFAFGVGLQEALPIAVVLVLLFGVKKLPEIARGLGEGMKEFKKAVRDVASDDETPATATPTPESPDTIEKRITQ